MNEKKIGEELNSEATAIKLLGAALEKVEKEMLLKMGVQIGGICPTIEIVKQPGNGMMGVRVSMIFDFERLNEYFNESADSIQALRGQLSCPRI
jgi:hypothetical protein